MLSAFAHLATLRFITKLAKLSGSGNKSVLLFMNMRLSGFTNDQNESHAGACIDLSNNGVDVVLVESGTLVGN